MESRIWHAAYDAGVAPQIALAPLSVVDMLARTAARTPDRPAIVFFNRTLTFGELQHHVQQFAAALADLGVSRGTRIAIHLPNMPQLVIGFFAALRLGAQVVMTNPLYTSREIIHQWRDAEVRVALTADFLYESRLAPARSDLPAEQLIIASLPEYLRFPLNLLAPFKLRRASPPAYARVKPASNLHRFGTLLAQRRQVPPAVSLPFDQPAILQYTGGTTGVSRGAILTHGNLSANVQQLRAWFPRLVENQEVFLAALPYFHVFGMTVCMMLPVHIGATMVVLPNPRDIRQILRSIARQRVTMVPAVPAIFNGMLNHPELPRANLRSVKLCFSGAAPLAEETLQRFEQLTGAKIVEGFGLTEASPVTHVNPLEGLRKIGHIGLPLPGTDARIVALDDSNGAQPPNHEGELLVRGPQVMQGYWGRPQETAEVLADGWLHTGDLAAMDEQGYFRIVGRKKDMILAGGYNIYPDEVDNVLMMHDGILEAASIGIPDPKRGETVKSFIVRKPGYRLTEEDVIAHCRANLAAYKVPKQIAFRSELPKSSVLKILRRELRDEELRKAPPAA